MISNFRSFISHAKNKEAWSSRREEEVEQKMEHKKDKKNGLI